MKHDNGIDYIYRLEESTGEKEVIFDLCKYLEEDYKVADVWSMELVDGKLLFSMQYGHIQTMENPYIYICYNCDSDIVEEVDSSATRTSLSHSDLKEEYDNGGYKTDTSWIYSQGDLRDPNEQYYGEYLYGIAITPETEDTDDWSECWYAPRDFCMIKTWDIMDDEVGDDLITLDTHVTQFNVEYDYIYYAKAESGTTTIWRRDLDGGNPLQIASIENDAWVIDIVVGDDVMICTFSDWEYNRDLHISENVFDIYVVDIDSGEVELLDDLIVDN